MELLEDHVADRHRERCVGALLGREPEVGELRGLAVIGTDDDALGALVARLGVEVGIGRARLRHVRAPENEERRVVPVRTLGHVRLLAPGLRARGRQVAVPVVEAEAGAADEREVAAAGGVRHHRHGGNRREADDAVRPVGLDRVDIGRRDDLVHELPARADEAAAPAGRLERLGLRRVFDDRRPGLDRLERAPRLAPKREQTRAQQRIFQPIAAVEIPGVAGASGAAARLMVGQVRPRARIIGLLRLPGDDAALDVDLPAA